MTNVDAVPRQQLENAFLAFNQVSAKLADSYALLQQRIGQFGEELAASRCERMRQLAEKEHFAHRFAQLLDTLPAAVVVVDREDRVEQFNPAAGELFESLAVGISWKLLERQFVSANPQRSERRLSSGREVSFIERKLDRESGRIMLLLDITETRRLQRQAARQQRLGVMGEMAAKLAHQIRTPLSSALLYNSHLSREDLTPEQRLRFSQRSRRCLLNMERQINDMLSYARGGEYECRPLEMNDLLRELLQTLEPIAREREITFKGDGMHQRAMVSGDRGALLGALMNIVVNALEHSPDGGVISIRLRDTGGNWELQIDDQGPGIPEPLRGRIFDPFFTTRNQGTGLGLAVSQAVALGHGGSIEVGVGTDGGGNFRFSLPRLIERQTRQPEAAASGVLPAIETNQPGENSV